MLLYYLEFLELGTGTCEASVRSMLREGDWDHIRDMIHTFIFFVYIFHNLLINSGRIYKHKAVAYSMQNP